MCVCVCVYVCVCECVSACPHPTAPQPPHASARLTCGRARYIPSDPNRTKHMGSDGTRAQARAEVAVAAPMKLPRQEGFMVDRDKDGGIDEQRMAAHRLTAARDQTVTRKDEITEEAKLAHKQTVVLVLQRLPLLADCVCAHVCMDVCVYTYVYVPMPVYMYMGLCTCMCICTCECILTHTHTHTHTLEHKQVVLEGPGKLEDTDYDELDLRPSELALKIKEKRGAYAVPKDQGQNEGRDARPIPQELQLKPPVFARQKGSGEDKMRSAYY